VKKLLSILILLFVGLNGFGQAIETNEKYFYANTTIIDTVEYKRYSSSGNLISIAKGFRNYYKPSGDTLFGYINNRIYWENGQIRAKTDFSRENVTKKKYDRSGNIKTENIQSYKGKNQAERIYIIKDNGIVKCYFELFTLVRYHQGRIIYRGTRDDINGKFGTWEYYNKKTGALEREVKYKNGKKVSDEKITLAD
jgi:hypothetical protein